MKLVTIVGARPQFVKAAMLSRAVASHNRSSAPGNGITEVLIHTGQHYDYEMSDVFFETLELQAPAYHLGVGSGPQGWQTGEALKRTEEVLLKETPDVVMVYGDTNSTLAGALAAAKLHLPVAHVEAGLRSFNRQMPEEVNRVLTDHLSDLLFAPTITAVRNLEREGITRGVFLTGDVMFEAAVQYLESAKEKSSILHRLQLQPRTYALATVHRAENTDSRERLQNIVQALTEVSEDHPVIWPVHPRTRKALESFALLPEGKNGLMTLPPLPYQDMLVLEAAAKVILTDSGGVQKEARWFHVPCVTMRDQTEWVETLEGGWNRLAGAQQEEIVQAFREATSSRMQVNPEVEDGERASEIILGHLRSFAAEKDPD
jgi:UDP-GlcNAc3NAcA epimerase